MKLLRYLSLIIATVFLAACGKVFNPYVGVPINVLNYNHDNSQGYWLYRYNPENPEKPKIMVGTASTEFLQEGEPTCCIPMPKKWHDKPMFTLEWRQGSERLTSEERSTMHIKHFTLPYYEQPKGISLVFLENNQVELVFGVSPRLPDWQGTKKTDPFSECLQRYEAGVCYGPRRVFESETDHFASLYRRACRKILAGEDLGISSFSRTTKQECYNWERQCLRGERHPDISDKNMCRINWKHPVFGI